MEKDLLEILDQGHEEIDQILAQLRLLQQGGIPSSSTIQQALSKLTREHSGKPNRYLEILSKRLDDLMLHQQLEFQNYSPEEQVGISNTIAEIRIHFLLAAHSSACSVKRNSNDKLLNAVNQDDEIAVGPIVQLDCGVTYATVDNDLVLLLPDLSNQPELVLSSLSRLYHSGRREDWVLDFSAVKDVSLLLLSNIIAYRSLLQQQDRQLTICWLSDSLTRLPSIRRMIDRLDLQLIGGHWFTKPAPPSSR